MRKALALTVFLAMAPYANAQDTAKGDFTPTAEFRARYQFDQNVNANEEPSSQSNVNHRFKLGGTFKASDKMSATLGLIHRAVWGANANDLAEGTAADSTQNNENMILVQEAYGTWMMSDEFTLKFGRGGFTMADGSLISANDWEQDPTTFEGVLGTYEMEPVRISAFFVRFAELDANSGLNAGTTDQDPEANTYGLSFDFKALPAFLNTANVHVLQANRNMFTSAAGTSSSSQLRYGAVVGGAANIVDYKLNYEAHTGESKDATAAKTDIEGMMYQAEVGANFEEFMKSRVYVLYHMDSGTGTGATKNETYDNFYYEKHANSGLMDVVNWGNLTYISVGATMEPMDATTVGLHYHMFEKTEEASGVTAGTNGGMFTAGTLSATGTKIGDEIDLVATHAYDNGFMITGRLGMFMPGEVLKNGTPEQKDTYTTAFLEGKMSF